LAKSAKFKERKPLRETRKPESSDFEKKPKILFFPWYHAHTHAHTRARG